MLSLEFWFTIVVNFINWTWQWQSWTFGLPAEPPPGLFIVIMLACYNTELLSYHFNWMQTLPFAQASPITAEEIINVIPDLRIHWEDLSLGQYFRIRQRRSTSPKIMIVKAISSVVSHYSCYFHSPSEIAFCLQTLGWLSRRCLTTTAKLDQSAAEWNYAGISCWLEHSLL